MNDFIIIFHSFPIYQQIFWLILISWIIKKVFSYLYPLLDVFCYKEHHEDKKVLTGFWQWLFKSYDIGKYKNLLIRYRIFQHGLAVIFWFISYQIFYSKFPWYVQMFELLGLLACYYAMVFERKYYTIGKQEYLLSRYQETNENVYWLKRWYFAGYWLFMPVESSGDADGWETVHIDNGFRLWKFDLAYYIGLGVYYSVSVIYLFR